jgi:hypothetical protein
MQTRDTTVRWAAAVGFVLALVGSAWLVHTEWTRLRNAFDTQARIIHRLLSQQMGQHEAVLSTLTLLPPAPDVAVPLTAVYPHIRQVQVVAREQVPTTHTGDAPGLAAGAPVVSTCTEGHAGIGQLGKRALQPDSRWAAFDGQHGHRPDAMGASARVARALHRAAAGGRSGAGPAGVCVAAT